MSRFWTLISCLILSTAAQQRGLLDNFTSLGKSVQKEVVAVKVPLEETLVDIGSSQCSKVKKLFGVAYEQIEGEKEPDLNQLTLTYIADGLTMIYNITRAAELIPQSRDLNPVQNLVIFIHGFTDDPTKDSFGNIHKAFNVKGHYNVMALDGSALIRWLYLRSTSYVRFMGEKLGQTLAAMVNRGVNPSKLHIVGHSLGAHISGFTGKTFRNLTGHRVGRITGLDPAGPCFSHVDPELRLEPSDADFVDVIHTDGGVYGLKDPVGQVDYYPNSGSQQPNCLFQTCSHSRAWVYFSESVVNPEAFPAIKCKDWDAFKKGDCECESNVSFMGLASEPGTRGLYFLQTGDEAPYGLGQKGLNFTNNEGVVNNIKTFLG